MISIKNSILIIILLFLFSSFSPPLKVKNEKILADKKQSVITYTMVHPLHEWTGVSKNVNCVILLNSEKSNIESVAVSVSLSSFDSNNSNRDSHALEVLDAIQYPAVKFSSNRIERTGDSLSISGNLLFHNITRPITIKAKQTEAKSRIQVTGVFKVNITNFDIETPAIMGLKTKEEIELKFDVFFLH